MHNLEHGYTILWYDDTIAKDLKQKDAIEAISKKMSEERFIAAPWTSDDGKAFPDGKHIALTRWTADAKNPSDESHATRQLAVLRRSERPDRRQLRGQVAERRVARAGHLLTAVPTPRIGLIAALRRPLV